jgi:heme/copper-type cytochrome/quinol oxidase subunit 2
MTNKAIYKEAAAVVTVMLVLAGLPLLLWYWRSVAVPHRYAPGTKVIHLTAIADGGIWTQEQVVGYNYWWKNPARAEAIPLTQGDHVVLLLHSSDVQHSFVMRDLNIGPVSVPAGHTTEVKFDAPGGSVLNFLCMQVCGHEHSHMGGSFLIGERGGSRGGPRGADVTAQP